MNMHKDAWIGAGALAIVGIALAWYVLAHPAPAQAPISSPPAAAATSTSLDEHGQYYDITASYPATTPLAAVNVQANAAAVSIMKNWEIAAVAAFKDTIVTPNQEAVDNFIAQGQQIPATMTGLQFSVSYRQYASPRTVSYVFDIVSYSGGAHGGEEFKTFTFDRDTGAALALSGLFTPNAPYLARLSTITRADLPASIMTSQNAANASSADVDRQMLTDGTAPVAENFQDFYLDGDNLVLLFPPYQIAAFAFGPQQDTIPLSKLSDILKPEYQAQ